ncbi:hypothetical protein ABPG75_000628 [Micractinium tetrahymenae]
MSRLSPSHAKQDLGPGVVSLIKQLITKGHFRVDAPPSPGGWALRRSCSCPAFSIDLSGEEWGGLPMEARMGALGGLLGELEGAYLSGGKLSLRTQGEGLVGAEQAEPFAAAQAEQLLRLLREWYPTAWRDPALARYDRDFRSDFFGKVNMNAFDACTQARSAAAKRGASAVPAL